MSMPTLLLSGELSPPLFGDVIGQLAAVLPRAERHIIPGVSHDLGEPATFTGPVVRFLAERA
jgi:pimeloyl-ACP methyl ester carboxylesterase